MISFTCRLHGGLVHGVGRAGGQWHRAVFLEAFTDIHEAIEIRIWRHGVAD